jgi:uncharacterized membrane protein YdjX (TVP38/TMEM64 family)
VTEGGPAPEPDREAGTGGGSPSGPEPVGPGGSGPSSRWGSILVWATFIIGIASVLLISPENAEVRNGLQALGPFAPLAYFLGEVVQVVIIPIPGQPFEVAGGWLLGLASGSLIGSAGAIAGSLIAFHIARRFGRDWVHRHVGGGVQNRVARELQKGARMEWIVFWLMMIPNFPRDPLCYVAGVSGMRSRGFVLIALLGRPVGLVPWVALGAEGVASGVAWQLGMIGVAAAIWLASRLIRSPTGSREADPRD